MARAAVRFGLPKAKPKTPKAWTKDAVEKTYLESVKNASAYIRVERELNNFFPCEGSVDLDELLMPLCQACWSLCEQSFVQEESGSLYLAAREEAQRLQKQLTDCTLMAMKQVNASRSAYQHDGDMGDETIQFFEPLQFLDQGTKDLVLMITADKVKQIASGTLPSEQVRTICEALSKSNKGGVRVPGTAVQQDLDSEADVEELAERLQETEKSLRAAQEQRKAAEKKAAQIQQQCDELRQQAEGLHQQALRQQADLLVQVEEARESQRAAEARLQEAEKAQAEILQLRLVCQEAEAKAAALSEELQSERQVSNGLREELRKEIEAAEERKKKEAEAEAALASLAAARQKAEEMQAVYAESEATRRKLEARASSLEEEAARLRAELAELRRPSGGVSQGAQTTLKSSEVESLEAENKRLKVALEELRAKLGDLMNECKKKGIAPEQMEIIAEAVGLKPLMKAKSVFEKLYEDAMLRVGRLENLRQRYHAERCATGAGRHEKDKAAWRGQQQVLQVQSPRRDSPNVLEALQHSSIVEELPLPPQPPSPRSSPSPPRRTHGHCSPSTGFASLIAIANNSTAAVGSMAPVAAAAPEQPTSLRDLVQRAAHAPAEKACGLRPGMQQAAKQMAVPEEAAANVGEATSAGLMFPPSWVAFNSALSGTPVHPATASRAVAQQVAAAPAASAGPAAPVAPAAPTSPAAPLGTLPGGGELARRLAASTSLPTLGRSPPSGLRCPGGAMPRHPAGLARDSSWR